MSPRVFPLLIAAFMSLAGATAGRQATPTSWPADNPFGIIESYEDPPAAGELGVSWTRITFHWAKLQPDDAEEWLAETDDRQIDQELDEGRQILGLMIGLPEWARDENRLPAGLELDPAHPGNTWAGFVRQAVGRYAGRIDHWVIWNEPDIRDTEIAHTWDGSVAQFARLQQVAYLAAKEANPQSVIHLSAFTYWADYYAGSEQYMARLLDEIGGDPQAAKNNHYFDVATAHLYFQPSQIYDLLTLFLTIMRDRGLSHPIWLVETNAPPRDDPAWPVPNWTLSVTLDEQAAFVPQVLASALAAGAERVALYKLKDSEEDRLANPEPFGLIRQDGRRRTAFTTYREAILRLSSAFQVERERWDSVGQIRLDQEGQTTTVLFARLPHPQQAQIKATAGEAELVNMWGQSQTIFTSGGEFQISLPPALCTQPIGDYCMIGGTTYYLVQAADISRPSPTPTGTSAPTETPTPSPSATPSPGAAPETRPAQRSTVAAAGAVRPSPERPAATITPAFIAAEPGATRAEMAGLVTGGPQTGDPESKQLSRQLAAGGLLLVAAAAAGLFLRRRSGDG